MCCPAHYGCESFSLTDHMLAGVPPESMQDIETAFEAAHSLLNKVSPTPRTSDLLSRRILDVHDTGDSG